MSAVIAGQCIDHSQWCYLKFIGKCIIFKPTFFYGRSLRTASACSPKQTCLFALSFDFFFNIYPYPIYNPIGGDRVLEEAWNPLSDNSKDIFRIAE
jgi:hypothetical protein